MSHPGPKRQILASHQVDDVARALIALTREVWVLLDRQTVLEAALARNGIDLALIDAAEPDAEIAAKLDLRRRQLLETVLGELQGGPASGPDGAFKTAR